MAFGIGVILLIFLGAGLLFVLEAMLPAHGLIGAIGVVLVLVGVGAVFYYNQWAGVGVAYALAAATPFAIVLWMKVWPRTPIGRRLVLSTPASPREADRATHTTADDVRIGQTGVATSELRPGGTCEFGGERVGCSAEHGVIPRGTPVLVIGVVDGRPVVRPA